MEDEIIILLSRSFEICYDRKMRFYGFGEDGATIAGKDGSICGEVGG